VLELLRIEGCENIAKVVVRGRSIAERPKSAQKIDLLLAKEREIKERLGDLKVDRRL